MACSLAAPPPHNCLSLGWRSRPDKWTQIVSGDGLKRSVCSLLYHSSSIACAWQSRRRNDGWVPHSFSIKFSLCSLSLTHFSPLGFSSFSHDSLPASFCNSSLCCLFLLDYHPVCLSSLPLSLFILFVHVCFARLNDCLRSRCKQTQTLKLLEQRDLSFSVCCHLSVRISVSSVCLHSILRSKCCGPSSSTSLL